ncbi:DNA mismatch repair protein MutS [Bdellovibrio bacteriovorus]|uniref:DNA mismatch repair protein MutS n=1 Tax=Bdellovibrio bacteriovorus TaxID=959 RepID=A0A150WE77_BDEBC|nr:DNA mismatch repair protein MutS [Bdellovibrio bacteriovorus]KYG61273.1 DNA mismatch repair protein MutS [Bdellovibrio bacteriovorus]
MSNLTPLMKQFWDIKSVHQDKILLFRMGDFFEMFFDDAVKAAPVLGIALTQRNKKSADETPMCGVPHHSIAGPINKLLAAGFKVAICDQLEDPKMAKGIVKRGVTRVLTPGMVYDSDTLDGTKPHYLVSLDNESISFLDTTTGEAFFFRSQKTTELLRFLQILPVAEIVISKDDEALLKGLDGVLISFHEDVAEALHDLLKNSAPLSAARLVSYVTQLSGEESIKTLSPFVERDLEHRLEISGTVLRHLEVFSTYKGEGLGSLFHAINRTQTSAGSRLLRQWLSFPLRDTKAIEQRLTSVEFWRSHVLELKRVRQILGQMGDIERRLGKISQPQCNGRDLLALAGSVHAGISALEVLVHASGGTANFEPLRDLAYKIERTLVEDPPLATKQGYLIRQGVSAELDELIELSTHSQALVARMEAEEKEKTGISSLKIRYNNVFGYYIEITNTHKDKAPAHYQRKQTLTNAERYCTDELVELERKVLSANTKRADLEFEFFEALRKEILAQCPALLTLAHECSEVDVVSGLAWLSLEEKYVRPQFTTDGSLKLRASRHPVVEQTVKKNFVANDIELRPHSCLLLTGPNMAGKSTLMRQVALIAIMAQMGSFVPADEVSIPVFDAIFTRIGASDQLSEGLSTFMVEMTETSAMLKNATKDSLVILDEVGRGTSTFDGMCLAQSILEHLLSETKALTFFATHYHELTSLDQSFGQITNAHMTVAERNGEIRFLHTLVKGPALKSYGVQVAELAGLPASVTKRAKGLLRDIESKRVQASSQLSLLDQLHSDTPAMDVDPITTFTLPEEIKSLMAEVEKYPLMQMSPLDAMNQIAKWKEIVARNGQEV